MAFYLLQTATVYIVANVKSPFFFFYEILLRDVCIKELCLGLSYRLNIFMSKGDFIFYAHLGLDATKISNYIYGQLEVGTGQMKIMIIAWIYVLILYFQWLGISLQELQF